MDTQQTLRYFEVTLTAKNPAAGDRSATTRRYLALDASAAVKAARAEAKRNGYSRHDGGMSYRAKLAESQEPDNFGW